jgi:hypothetical protein
VSGGYDGQPVVCDTCSEPQPVREALERGSRLDAALTAHTAGVSALDVARKAAPEAEMGDLVEAARTHTETLEEATRHPLIKAMVAKLKKTKGVSTQESIVLDSSWRRVSQFTKGAWARLKLDVLVLKPKIAEVIDWKSGNISQGMIRERPEYHDSMRAYQMAVLSVYPQAEASAKMVFLDAAPKLEDPTKSLPILKRIDLDKARKDWEAKIAPMFKDEKFNPRPGFYCRWCPYRKDNGGPCAY